MNPISITLQGIYSYRQAQTIDFTKLIKARLFGIFGAVGSGKSTILEAISFALYDRTERLSKGDNRNYNMMNLKSNELIIDFSFTVGVKNKEEFRFVVTGKRSPSVFEDVQFDRKAFKRDGTNWTELPVADASRILGLSYENFRRTIIIPQGKFQEFLQLGDGDRSRTLREIFRLERFDLEPKLRLFDDANRSRLQIMLGKYSSFKDASPELIEEKQAEISTLQTAVETLLAGISTKEDEEREYATLKDTGTQIIAQEKILQGLKKRESDSLLRENRIQKYEIATEHFKSLLDGRDDYERKIDVGEEDLALKIKRLSLAQNTLESEEEDFIELKTEFYKRDEFRRQVSEMQTMLEYKKLSEELEKLSKRRTGDEIIARSSLQKILDIQNSLREQIVRTKSKKSEIDSFADLSAIEQWFAVKHSIEGYISSRMREIDRLRATLTESEERRNRVLAEPEMSEMFGDKINAPVQELLPAINLARTVCEQEIESVNVEIEQLSVQKKVEEFILQLHDGQPCPLCGALEHPAPFDPHHVAEKLNLANLQRVEARRIVRLLDNAQRELERISEKTAVQEEMLGNLANAIENDRCKLSAHIERFTWENFSPDDEESVQNSRQKIKELYAEFDENERIKSELEAKLESARKEKEKSEQFLATVREMFAGKSSELERLKFQISYDTFDYFIESDEEEIRENINLVRDRLIFVEKEYIEREKFMLIQKREAEIISANIEADYRVLRDYYSSIDEINSNIRKEMKTNGIDDLSSIEHILSIRMNVEQERQFVERYKVEFLAATERLAELQLQAGGKYFAEETYRQMLKEVATKKRELSETDKRIGFLQAEIRRLEQGLAQRAETEAQIAILEKRADDISALKRLFAGSGFINFVAGRYLKTLCATANKRFAKLTKNTMSLEISDANTFAVRDNLHDGRVRSVKTFSGGQTFQAALCLALALSENIQSATGTHENFFFLDEGFGSQDKDSLKVVVDTLKSLKKEKRIIGIISHVEELQNEMGAFLIVKNSPAQGSILEIGQK